MSQTSFDHVTIVVFGASGDLAKKMTYPAIFSLVKNGRIKKDQLHVVGTARSKYAADEFRDKISAGLKGNDELTVKGFLERCSYVSLKGYEDAASYKDLDSEISKLESGSGKHLRLFYIALPPSAFKDVSENVRKSAWPKDKTNRLIVEKPYGKDTKSAKELSKHLEEHYSEEELYRIDHYLGKDTVKCVLPLRFGANPTLAATWSREHIQYVTVDFKEKFGAEGRGGYFDEFGMIRDVMQNHIMQWIVMFGMEKPKSLSSKDIHEAKLKFHNDCLPVKPEDVLVGQYGASKSDPEKKAYLDDETVDDNSKAATYATAILYVDNERWRGVPFVIRAGKALDETRTEVIVHYKSPKDSLFATEEGSTLTIRDKPDKTHTLSLFTKKVGSGFKIVSAPLVADFGEKASPLLKEEYVPTAYETLIYEAVQGDHTWFIPRQEAEEGWRVWDDAIKGTEDRKPFIYEYGSAGPKEEAEFLKKYGVHFGTGANTTVDVAQSFSGKH
ncbi:glucose-6-phosphate dehydrogenase (NADP+) [Powellomyces hirtus]|uniref:Glucose-6-phosphate 1-dehydrogenase n=1 Tax=Powellomyces hirtus TaxID=109895 RepID=A0A507E9F3_9FUNG|nr:glucose-6-phosphate dehydrogenase (NADP+) [Powellomyces hirtus]